MGEDAGGKRVDGVGDGTEGAAAAAATTATISSDDVDPARRIAAGDVGREDGTRWNSSSSSSSTTVQRDAIGVIGGVGTTDDAPSSPPWKAVYVNDGARNRRARSSVVGGVVGGRLAANGGLRRDDIVDGGRRASTTTSSGFVDVGSFVPVVAGNHGYNYGIVDDDVDRGTYVNLFDELTEYMSYMTVQRTSSSMSSGSFGVGGGGGGGLRGKGPRGGGLVREETARVYMTHARLFLGWIVDARGVLVTPSEEEGGKEEEEDGGRDRAPSLDRALSNRVGGTGPDEGGDDARGGTTTPSSSPLRPNVVESVRDRVWTHVRRRTAHPTSATPATPTRMHDGDMPSLRQIMSLCDIFPNPSAESSSPVLQYVLWLRSERGISQNYEANM